MSITLDEQPPEDTPEGLKDWLARLTHQININSRTQSIQGGDPAIDGLFMRWTGAYIPGKRYYPGEVVTQDGFTMICVNVTEDVAAPQPDGPATWSLPDVPAWSIEVDGSNDIKSGNDYTINQIGWIEGLRVWAPTVAPNIDYWVRVTGEQGQILFAVPFPIAGEWTPVIFTRRIVSLATQISAILETIDSAGNTNYVELAGNWPGSNPTWGTVEGSLAFLNAPQPGVITNAYGTDILFQPAIISPDWEVVATPEV